MNTEEKKKILDSPQEEDSIETNSTLEGETNIEESNDETKEDLTGSQKKEIAELNDKDNTCVVETLAGKIKMERSSISLEMSAKLSA